MLSLLLLQARDSESDLVDHLYKIVTHIRENGLTQSEKGLVQSLYNRLNKLGSTLLEVIEHHDYKTNSHDPLEQSIKQESIYADSETESLSRANSKKSKKRFLRSHSKKSGLQPYEASPKRSEEFLDLDSVLVENNDSCDSVSSSLMDRLVSIRKEEPSMEDRNRHNSEPIAYEFTPGARQNSNLLYTIDEKQLYRRQNRSGKKDRYICRVNDCLAVLYMYDKGILKRPLNAKEHNHVDQEQVYLRNKFQTKIKKDLLARNINESTSKLFQEHLKNDPVGGASVNFRKVKRNLDRIRRQMTIRRCTNSHLDLPSKSNE